MRVSAVSAIKPMVTKFLASSALSIGSLLVSANYLLAQAQGYWSCYSRNPDTGVSSLSRTGSTEEIARQRLRDEVCQYNASSCDPFRPAIYEFVPFGTPTPQPPQPQPPQPSVQAWQAGAPSITVFNNRLGSWIK
jgi:hypothetical protein